MYYGHMSGHETKHNTFNNLFRTIQQNDNMEKSYSKANYGLDLSRKYDDKNLLSQLYGGFYGINGKPYQQLFKLPVQQIINREQEEDGRNTLLLKMTNERYVDISGQYYKAKDIPLKSVGGKSNFSLEVVGLVK